VKPKGIIPIEDQYFRIRVQCMKSAVVSPGKGVGRWNRPFTHPTTKVLRKGGALSLDLLYPYTSCCIHWLRKHWTTASNVAIILIAKNSKLKIQFR